MNHYECYFDASYTPEISRCAYCVLVDGQIVHTHVHKKKLRNSHKAEKHALYLLLQYIQQHIKRRAKIEIYGDEKTVINRVVKKGRRSKDDKAGKMYDRIEPLYELTIQHIPGKQNKIAHKLSRTGLIPPPKLKKLEPRENVTARLMQLNDIIIPDRMKYGRPPGKEKYQSRLLFFQKHGEMYKTILVNSDGMLLDGYITYLILKEHGMDECCVDVEV